MWVRLDLGWVGLGHVFVKGVLDQMGVGLWMASPRHSFINCDRGQYNISSFLSYFPAISEPQVMFKWGLKIMLLPTQ